MAIRAPLMFGRQGRNLPVSASMSNRRVGETGIPRSGFGWILIYDDQDSADPPSGIVISTAGFKLTGSVVPTLPIRIDWKIFGGLDCALDTQPLFEGSTFIQDMPGSEATDREGVLLEINNRVATRYALQGQVTDGAGALISLSSTFSARGVYGSSCGDVGKQAGCVIG